MHSKQFFIAIKIICMRKITLSGFVRKHGYLSRKASSFWNIYLHAFSMAEFDYSAWASFKGVNDWICKIWHGALRMQYRLLSRVRNVLGPTQISKIVKRKCKNLITGETFHKSHLWIENICFVCFIFSLSGRLVEFDLQFTTIL